MGVEGVRVDKAGGLASAMATAVRQTGRFSSKLP
jgi:hypothetical protein